MGKEIVKCECCKKTVEFMGEEDFHFEVPVGFFPPPFDHGKGVCLTCWNEKGYKGKYEEYRACQKLMFVDEKEAIDTPELKLREVYYASNNDGQLVDIFDHNKKIGTFCVERFISV